MAKCTLNRSPSSVSEMTSQTSPHADDNLLSEYTEMDVTGRYGRYDEVLGKGAFKTVYRAFDEVDGIEVAWNQVKIQNMLQSPGDLEQLYSEVHVLRKLRHKNIMRIYSSWVDTQEKHVNFITELFTSGTLREYRKRHKHVRIQAIKKWARQILSGLNYLHTHDPPIVHRDLKCDNIFINGSQGEVKIGDFGLAAILPQGHTIHSIVGTPEFVAPEIYEKDYDELVDIYSFGMCVLELVTVEYPYSECTTVLEIYKAVTSGKKPAALNRVQDPLVKAFVKRCLCTAETRPSAQELLLDPFLQCEEDRDSTESRITPLPLRHTESYEDFQRARSLSAASEKGRPSTNLKETPLRSSNVRAKGERTDDDTLSLRLRIADYQGHVRQIQFPFVLDVDTAMGVASEVIAEFELLDEDLMTIADIIDAEVRELVPDWQPTSQSQDSCVCNGQTSDVGPDDGSVDEANGVEISQVDLEGLFNCRPKPSVVEKLDECWRYQIYT
ncbi:unnamed protein product [Calypogeia fissa]